MEQILTKDLRGLKDLTPINYKAFDITFYEMIITGNYAGDIEFMIKGEYNLINFKPEIYSFDSERKIYQHGNTLIVEYLKQDLRNKDKELFKENFGKDKDLVNNPRFCGYFDYNGKFYLIVDSDELPTDETNIKKGIYKGIVVKPELYLKKDKKLIEENKRNTLKIL